MTSPVPKQLNIRAVLFSVVVTGYIGVLDHEIQLNRNNKLSRKYFLGLYVSCMSIAIVNVQIDLCGLEMFRGE